MCLALIAPVGKGIQILGQQIGRKRLAGPDREPAALELEGPHGADDDFGVGLHPADPALDVEELFGAAVGPEAALCDDIVGQARGRKIGQDRAVALGDVGERARVDQGGRVVARLHQVWPDGVAEQRRHRTGGADVLGEDGLACRAQPHQDSADSTAQILQAGGKRQDRHDLRGGRQIKSRFAHGRLRWSPQAGHDVRQPLVVHVQGPLPGDRRGVEQGALTALEVASSSRVSAGCFGLPPRRAGRRGVAAPDLVGGHERGPAAACTAPLDAEHGALRRLPERGDGRTPDPAQAHRQANRRHRLALAQRSRADRADADVPDPCPRGEPLFQAQGQLALVPAERFDVVGPQAEPGGDGVDPQRSGSRVASVSHTHQ